MFRRILPLIACALLAVGLDGVAVAETTGDKHVGSFYLNSYTPTPGGGNNFVLAGWAQASYNTPRRDEINLIAEAGNLPGDPGEWCLQIAFDFEGRQGHYDPRIVRNCDSQSTRRTPVDYYEDLCGIVPCDMPAHSVQIAMYQPSSGGVTEKRCWLAPGIDRTCASWNPADSVNCARIWGRRANGTNWYQGGGNPRDCDS